MPTVICGYRVKWLKKNFESNFLGWNFCLKIERFQHPFLINTARGDVLDIKALARAIGGGKVAAAGLDVLPEEGGIREETELLRSVYDKKHDLETMLINHILLHLRNVIITPHSAFNTWEAVERILSTTVGNIASFTSGVHESGSRLVQRSRHHRGTGPAGTTLERRGESFAACFRNAFF